MRKMVICLILVLSAAFSVLSAPVSIPADTQRIGGIERDEEGRYLLRLKKDVLERTGDGVIVSFYKVEDGKSGLWAAVDQMVEINYNPADKTRKYDLPVPANVKNIAIEVYRKELRQEENGKKKEDFIEVEALREIEIRGKAPEGEAFQAAALAEIKEQNGSADPFHPDVQKTWNLIIMDIPEGTRAENLYVGIGMRLYPFSLAQRLFGEAHYQLSEDGTRVRCEDEEGMEKPDIYICTDSKEGSISFRRLPCYEPTPMPSPTEVPAETTSEAETETIIQTNAVIETEAAAETKKEKETEAAAEAKPEKETETAAEAKQAKETEVPAEVKAEKETEAGSETTTVEPETQAVSEESTLITTETKLSEETETEAAEADGHLFRLFRGLDQVKQAALAGILIFIFIILTICKKILK